MHFVRPHIFYAIPIHVQSPGFNDSYLIGCIPLLQRAVI